MKQYCYSKRNKCVDCGKVICNTSKRCCACANKLINYSMLGINR